MKIICVGHNYNAHNKEMNREALSSASDPVLFMKPDSAILHNDKNQFYLPDFSENIHYELEVVIKIDKMGKNIAERFAHRYYNEITIGIDFTARDLQDKLKAKGLPWEISKGFDNSAALGTFVPKDKFGKAMDDLDFTLLKNGEQVQIGNTKDMIHSIDKIVAYASQFFTLKTGDLIFTGTPAGVGRVDIGDTLIGKLEGEDLLNVLVC
ncbi:fumarylacetoacetate hydrolase family protein [Dysgonomonas massiliensis]|uniref:fumarylacetoacetate hydrolase family protein n=1 Tax=Dysgonomonas massiliensis TaxID=2040292 RepID=UPI000C772FC4|nr:fumarylacetoacetate hydrolase family protein [Dysgonomonas massiliensis]